MRGATKLCQAAAAMTISPDARFVFSRPDHAIAFGFGAGLSPFAPGTVGTLLGYPLFFGLHLLTFWGFWAAVAALFVVGVWCCDRTGRALGVHDHGGMVWDEVVAFVAILYFTPVSPGWLIAAFFIFRVFDVWKPFPIRYFDHALRHGFGVMFDDALAAIYSILLILALRHAFA